MSGVPGAVDERAPNAPAPRVPGYEVVAAIGAGSSSHVYRARRDERGAAVGGDGEYAVKILRSPGSGAALRREVAMVAGVDHPRLARCLDVGEADGLPYVVMDLVPGTDLSRVIGQEVLPPVRAVQVVADLAGQLAAIHARGLVHRDVKPGNVVMDPGPPVQATLVDYGLAARGGVDDGDDRAPVVGTLTYSSPEQSGMLARPVDARSDLYSLGVLMFECLAGRPPFAVDDVGELLRLHATAAPPPLADLVPGLPAALPGIVARLLAKDPDDRYQDAHALLADLATAVPEAGVTPPAPPSRPPLPGRGRETAALVDEWQRARAGGGGLCLVRGPAGAGKSALVAEVAAAAAPAPVLRGKCSPDDVLALWPLRSAVEGYLASLERVSRTEPEAAAGAGEIVRSVARDLGGSLTAMSPRLAAAVGVPARDGADEDEVTRAVAAFLVSFARAAGGLLLVVDDVQWLDPGSERVLHLVAAELEGADSGAPLLVLATARDDESSAAAVVDSGLPWVSPPGLDPLGPLDRSGVVDLAAAVLPRVALPESLVRVLETRGAGNPFVTSEMLRAVVDAGLLSPCRGEWVLDEVGLADLDLPQDALALVVARVDALGPRVRDVLAAGAVCGNRFSALELAAVLDVPVAAVMQDLTEAVDHRLVEPVGGDGFAFVHDRVREALAARLGDGAPALHLRIARALDGPGAPPAADPTARVLALARHYVAGAGAPGADAERVFHACLTAGETALASHAPALALDMALEAAARTPAGAEPALRARVLRALGTAERDSSRYDDAARHLEDALALEQEPLVRAAIRLTLGETYRATWRTADAAAAVEAGLADAGARLPRNPLWLWLSSLAMFLAGEFSMRTGIGRGSATGPRRERLELVQRLHEAAVYNALIGFRRSRVPLHTFRYALVTALLGHGEVYVRGQGGLALFFTVMGRHRRAAAAFAAAVADPAAVHPRVRAIPSYYRGVGMIQGYADSGEMLTRVMAEFGSMLELGAFCDACAILGVEAAADGRVAEADHWLSLSQARRAHDRHEITSMMFTEPVLLALLGRPTDAAVSLREAHLRASGTAAPGMRFTQLSAAVNVLNEQADFGSELRAALDRVDDAGIDPASVTRTHRAAYFPMALARLALLRAAVASGAPEPELREARDRARLAVRRTGSRMSSDKERWRFRIARAGLAVAEGRPRRALALLDRAREPLPSGAPRLGLEAARARARALLAMNRQLEARSQALAAAALADDAGLHHLALQVRTEFGLTGATGPLRTAHTTGQWSGSRLSHAGTSTSDPGRALDRRRFAALQQVSLAASRLLEPESLARTSLDATLDVLGAQRALLFLAAPSGVAPWLGRSSAGEDLPALDGYSASLVERVAASGEPLVVTGTDEGAALGSQSVVLHNLRSVLIAPLRLDDRILGVVYLDSQVAKGIFTEADVAILTAMTTHIATALETARAAQLEISLQSVRRQRDTADGLRAALEDMASADDPAEVLVRLATWARRIVPCDDAAVVGTAPGADRSVGPDGLAVPVSTGQHWLVLRGAGVAEHAEVAAALAAQAGTAHDRAVLFARVQALAVKDELTGVPNRRHFFESASRNIADGLRSGQGMAALMVDIDHFKRVNDTHGHPTGDDVIREVAARLAGVLRNGDLLGRYGGEEFAVLLQASGERAAEIAERLRAAVADDPVPTRSGPLAVTVSVGLTAVRPDDGGCDAVFARADAGLYVSKSQGRNRVTAA